MRQAPVPADTTGAQPTAARSVSQPSKSHETSRKAEEKRGLLEGGPRSEGGEHRMLEL